MTRRRSIVARLLGIRAVEAELLPDAKHARIQQLVASGRVVAMVGDGIKTTPGRSRRRMLAWRWDQARMSRALVLLGDDLMTFAEPRRHGERGA
jgi:hypothetical protein